MQRLDPDGWEKDIAKAEQRIGDRRHAERRRRDRWGRYIERGALLAMVVIMVVGWTRYDAQQAKIDRLVTQQREGRAVAIDALCGAVSGVIDAGRKTLLAGATVGTPGFERHLEAMGFPPLGQRQVQAEAAARAYGQAISVRVEKITHHKGLTRPDGTIDCTKLKVAAKAK